MNYARLTRWLRIWSNLLREPRDLLLERHFPNVVRATLVRLEDRYDHKTTKVVERSGKGLEQEYLRLLERIVTSRNSYLDLLRRDHATELIRLEALLSQGKWDVAQIYPLLLALRDLPTLNDLKAYLLDELWANDIGGRGHDSGTVAGDGIGGIDSALHAISLALLQKLLLKHSADRLERLPAEMLGRQCAALLLNEHLAAVTGHADINRQLIDVWWPSLMAQATTERVAALVHESSDPLFGTFDRVLWWSLQSQILVHVASDWQQTLQQLLSQCSADHSPVELLRADRQALEQLGERVVRRFALYFLRQVFDVLVLQRQILG